jgi:hypothetical protein
VVEHVLLHLVDRADRRAESAPHIRRVPLLEQRSCAGHRVRARAREEEIVQLQRGQHVRDRRALGQTRADMDREREQAELELWPGSLRGEDCRLQRGRERIVATQRIGDLGRRSVEQRLEPRQHPLS